MNHDNDQKALKRIASLPEADLDQAFGGGQGGQANGPSVESLAEELAAIRRRRPLGHVRRG
jgi:hypothetical protein